MKGIVLSGGLGTRLYPLTKIFNKHALAVYDWPILFYAIKTVVDADIKDILIVTGPPFGEQIRHLVSLYPNPGDLNFSFVLQEKPLGMPDAIAKCERVVDGDSVMVVPGDNLFTESFKDDVKKFRDGAMAYLRAVPDPSRFGVPIYRQGKPVDIVEKPKHPQTNSAVIAPYLFDGKVFEVIKKLKFSARGELEIVELLKLYLDMNKLSFVNKKGYWKDIGTFDALLEAGLKMQKLKNKLT